MIKDRNDFVRNNTLSSARVANALDCDGVFTATGTDTYAVTIGLSVAALAANDEIKVVIPNANTITTPSLAITGAALIGTYTIKANDGTAVSVGDLKAGGQYNFRFDGTDLRCTNLGGGGGSGSASFATITGNASDNASLVSYVAAEIGAAVAGLLDLRGTYDASGNAYPSSGGSGTAGAILKADAWVISVAGTLATGRVVSPGDVLFAIVDTPGSTEANWAIIENNLTYTPVNKAGDTMTGNLALNAETASRIAIIDGSKNIKSADTATYPSLTELSYGKGVTSPIQTQIDAVSAGNSGSKLYLFNSY